jgi:glutathione synthase/RimK-type ligase-like ATP-grasp enzyme
MSSPQTIGILAEARYLEQSQPTGLVIELMNRNHRIQLIDPQQSFYVMGDNAWLAGLDGIVARGRSWGLLGLLGWAEIAGVKTINTRESIASVHNKAQMSIAFASAGLPIPESYFGSISQLTQRIPAENYPIILKPIFGDNSRGLLVVERPDDLARTEWPEPVALAQRYFQTDGYDLKLYGIGDEIWAVRKPSPFNARNSAEASREGLAETTPHLTDLGRRCGQLFGLDLFGVDCIETSEGVLIIEINDYPNYTNVPDANARLADYVERKIAAAR